MDTTIASLKSLPSFIDLRSDSDNFLLLNDSSLSQQIEFILQDKSPTPSPPPPPPPPPQLLSPSTQTPPPTSTATTVIHKKINVSNDEENQTELNGIDLLKTATIKVEKIDENSDNELPTTVSPPSLLTSSSSTQTPTILSSTIRTSTVINNTVPNNSTENSNSKQGSSTPIAIKDEISTNKVEYRCTECLEKFDNKDLFAIHNSGHANNMKCAICNMVLKSLKNYEKHCLRCKPYECQVCGRVVRFRPNFIKHMRVHTTQQSERHKYKCEVCYKEFMSFEYFKVHKKIHNDNVNLTCNICGKVFSALASLRGHSKLHSGVKLHKCDVCGKGFGQRYNLKIHSRTHSGNFPFECKICEKKFHTQSSLQTHMQIHENQTPIIPTAEIKSEPIEVDFIKIEVDDTDAQMFESQPTTAEESSNDCAHGCDTVIKNYVQNGPQGIYAQKVQENHSTIPTFNSNVNVIATTSSIASEISSGAIELSSIPPCNSPSLAETAVAVKCEPNLYSSGDNSVEMLIKQEIFDDCSPHDSLPSSKFDSNFDNELIDSNDLSYSNLFEPNASMSHSIPDEIYPEDDAFELDTEGAYFGLQSTTDGDFIKKGWVYHTTSNYCSVSSNKFHDDISDDSDQDDLDSTPNYMYD